MEDKCFSPQGLPISGLRFSILIAALHSLVFVLAIYIYCIFLEKQVSSSVIVLIAAGVVFISIMTVVYIAATYTHSAYKVRGRHFVFYNGFYPFPLRLPIDKIVRIQPIKKHHLFFDNRTGLRLYFNGWYCLLPYHVDVYVREEDLFINTLLSINSTIVVTDEVATSWRICL